jgi:hypothetical protein
MVMIEQKIDLELASNEWTAALSQALTIRGFAFLTDYADSLPAASLAELAGNLGGEPFALEQKLVEEAEAAGQMQRCARGLFARDLRSEIPEGWRRDKADHRDMMVDQDFRIKGVFLTLLMAVPQAYNDAIERIEHAMESIEAPEGWLPAGPDDLILIELFESCWHAEAM